MADETHQSTLSGGYQTTLSGDAVTRVGHSRKDSTTVYIGRADDGDAHMLNTPIGDRGWLGNPFTVEEYGREQCIKQFREEFEAILDDDPAFRNAVRELHGEMLGCWCQRLEDNGPPCHGEVIAEEADRLANEVSGE